MLDGVVGRDEIRAQCSDQHGIVGRSGECHVPIISRRRVAASSRGVGDGYSGRENPHGCQGAINGFIDGENGVEPGDFEVTTQPVRSNDEAQLALGKTDGLETADKDPEAGRVKEADAAEIADDAPMPRSQHLGESVAQAGCAQGVNVTGETDDDNVADAAKIGGEFHVIARSCCRLFWRYCGTVSVSFRPKMSTKNGPTREAGDARRAA